MGMIKQTAKRLSVSLFCMHACVPESEVYPVPICESWGGLTVSQIFLQKLKKIIDASEKRILLKIFY